MTPRPPATRFILLNAIVWLLMIVILVVVPDLLEPWMSLAIARVLGWGAACAVWVIAVEDGWKARFGPGRRFVFQLVLWLSAALLAVWISEAARP
jgi:hypothetical protein